jgi:hypothetical protein
MPMHFCLLFSLLLSFPVYSWKTQTDPQNALQNRIAVPAGFNHCNVDSNSYAYWLRNLPLLPGRPQVHLYDGALKGNQSAHHAVIDIDVGNRDLQQCADAVMRLKAEYHFSNKQYEQIHFRFTSGDEAPFSKWQAGYRPRINGNSVSWVKSKAPSSSYENFRAYMNSIFTYCGTYSLSRELVSLPDSTPVQAGDVWIKGGFPGHAVMVVAVAENPNTGEQRFLLAQSYMPAQEMHILRNPNDPTLSPWYAYSGGPMRTPEWHFEAGSRMRFADLFDQ